MPPGFQPPVPINHPEQGEQQYVINAVTPQSNLFIFEASQIRLIIAIVANAATLRIPLLQVSCWPVTTRHLALAHQQQQALHPHQHILIKRHSTIRHHTTQSLQGTHIWRRQISQVRRLPGMSTPIRRQINCTEPLRLQLQPTIMEILVLLNN
jgi:hypothetical protein